jgi:UDP-2,3-diacylglucosamine hydrolase
MAQDNIDNPVCYFASDLHLGVPDKSTSLAREKKFIRWLDFVAIDATAIYLMGDVFDFWFEYRSVIPKGYARLFGKLAELSDAGIALHFFVGNHDMWCANYFLDEFNCQMHRSLLVEHCCGKRLVLAHGDGIGPGDLSYKVFKQLIRNPITTTVFQWIHPNIGIPLANLFSNTSRNAQSGHWDKDYGTQERLFQYAQEQLALTDEFTYFIFGHRHRAIQQTLYRAGNSAPAGELIVLGDWLRFDTYLRMCDTDVSLLAYQP